LTSPEERQRLGEAAESRARRCSLDAMVQATLAQYCVLSERADVTARSRPGHLALQGAAR
jgi:hypothetical protein